MIICTGRATKRIEEFRDLDKEYVADIKLGATTPSHDLETEVEGTYPVDHISEKLVRATIEKFLGEQRQVPPLHSAKLIKGKRAYEYARKGIEKELAPVSVIFREIDLISFSLPEIRIRMICSKGTYVRSFVRDLGLALGSGAYLSSLVRTSIGQFRIENAFSLENFQNFLKELKQI